MSGGESDARVVTVSSAEWWTCAVEDCQNEVIPQGSTCRLHGGTAILAREDDEGWGTAKEEPTRPWISPLMLGDECE